MRPFAIPSGKPQLSLVTVPAVGEMTTSNGKATDPIPLVWDNAITQWLRWLKISGLSANTVRLRRDHLASIARRSATGHPRELTLERLVDLFSENDWSKEYRKSMRTSLVQFGDWCVSNGLMADNPAHELPRVSGDKPRPRPAPDDVWLELLAAATPRERLMARLAGQAGMRRAEIAHARRNDLVRDRGGWAIIVRGKGDKQRVVPITASLAAAITEHCRDNTGDHPNPAGYLFPGPAGHLSARWVGTVLSRLMPPGWTAHTLRHRYATRGYAGTRNLRAVQLALGHASVATTERYTMITDDEVRAVSEAAGSGDDAA